MAILKTCCIRLTIKSACIYIGAYGMLMGSALAILLSYNIYGEYAPIIRDSFIPGTITHSLRRCFVISVSMNAAGSLSLVWSVHKDCVYWALPIFFTLPTVIFMQFTIIIFEITQVHVVTSLLLTIWMIFHAYLFLVFFSYVQIVSDMETENSKSEVGNPDSPREASELSTICDSAATISSHCNDL